MKKVGTSTLGQMRQNSLKRDVTLTLGCVQKIIYFLFCFCTCDKGWDIDFCHTKINYFCCLSSRQKFAVAGLKLVKHNDFGGRRFESC